ncbi:PAS domain-containing sensor histidine kinase [Natronococcus pandeyae]|uniref:histidine kinase n=1 Tax=Natronococcus pandeyae TaxID=2055836 RepID=A0A8J8PWT5_9EURY|nr:PAS domain-containing sensor histidine kinase [Natronococcus pandeyae]TYL36296.1 PAS domain-containing sensor histidine kinase [Natronococcus pandeyae]
MADTPSEYERLTERISDAYCAVDTEWQITYWNRRMSEWTGVSAADVEGDVLWDVVPALCGSAIESRCRSAMQTGESQSFEAELSGPLPRWVEVNSYADDDGLSIICREITERKVHEEQAELAETLFENTQDALFLIDLDGDEFRLERVNPAYESNSGLTNDELRGRRLQDVFGDEEGATILENYRECVARREPMEYEERVSVPDEGPYWETRLAPVIVDGAIEKLVGATRNITERKERERRYNAIFNQTYQFIGLMDPDGTLLEANESALEFGGLDRDDVVGRPIWETYWWQLDDGTRRELRDAVAAAADGEFVRYDVEVQGATETAIIDFSIRPIDDDSGEVALLVTEGRNITEHKRQAEKLEQKREFLRQIQTVAAIGGWEVDLRTGTSRWTEEVYRIHGMPRSYEPTVEEGIDFYHPRDRATIEEAFERLTREGEAYDLELQIVTNADEVRWVRTLGTPWYDGSGEIIGARGTFQDITERKERERELERTNEHLEEFASVVSHDLRNPLTVAQVTLELARQSGTVENFDRIEAAHMRMNALIDDLLTLARQGQSVTEAQPIALDSLIESAFETIPGDFATIELAIDEYRIEANEARLRQLVENLLSNAVTHGGDDVTIRVGLLDDGVGFYIADDGPGIDPAIREDVFDWGYSTANQGTGFGLAIVASIADAHGWTVEATESAEGGAQFDVYTGQHDPG